MKVALEFGSNEAANHAGHPGHFIHGRLPFLAPFRRTWTHICSVVSLLVSMHSTPCDSRNHNALWKLLVVTWWSFPSRTLDTWYGTSPMGWLVRNVILRQFSTSVSTGSCARMRPLLMKISWSTICSISET